MTRPNFSRDQLNKLYERIERLSAEKADLQNDIKEVFAEAKGLGFNVKVMRKVLARRKMDKSDLEEMDALIDLYEAGL